jgi:hypothetical protein
MFLQYLLSNFETLEDISKPITYGKDIIEKTREFSSLEDVNYLFGCLRMAQVDYGALMKGVRAPTSTATGARRQNGRDPIAAIESMTPGFKRYVSLYDDEDDFI